MKKNELINKILNSAEKNGIVIEGLEKPVSDISEHEESEEEDY